MGWTSYHAKYYKNGKIDRKAECDAYFMEGLNRGNFQVLKSTLKGSTYYAAIKEMVKTEKDDNGNVNYIPITDGKVFAVVFLTSVNMKDYFNFSYKDMTEDMCPCECDCPLSIIKLLSETDNEWANEWRNKCIEKANNKANSISKLPIGTKIRFTKHNGKVIECYKHQPAYQFKRAFWMLMDNSGYISAKHIPLTFEVIE